MKKLASILLALVLCLSLAACGGGSDEAPAASDQPASSGSAAAPAESAQTGCSDANWTALQNQYAVVRDLYNGIADAVNNGEVELSDEEIAGLATVPDLLEKVSAAPQELWTDEQAETVTASLVEMATMLQTLSDTLDGGAAAPTGVGCSDENWANLQAMYSVAVGMHSAVATAYNEGMIELSDANVEGLINMADYLQKIAAADQSTWDDETVVNLTNALDEFCAAMSPYAEALAG